MGRRGLSHKQLRALPLLVSGMAAADVARQVQVDASTISRWRSSPAFAAALEECQRQVLGAPVAEPEAPGVAVDDVLGMAVRLVRSAARLVHQATPAAQAAFLQALRDTIDRAMAPAPEPDQGERPSALQHLARPPPEMPPPTSQAGAQATPLTRHPAYVPVSRHPTAFIPPAPDGSF